jgi:serine/threonine protein kinase
MEPSLEKSKSIKVVEGDSRLYEDYQITKWIGKGLNMVYEVVETKTEKVEAIKEIRLADANDYLTFMNEISCLSKTKEHPHPSIINFIGYYITLDDRGEFNQYRNGYIQMEKGITSLSFFINKRAETKNYFTNQEVLNFISKMLEGHIHLQNLHIAHRDVKPENILICNTEELDYKICDVGVSTVTGEASNTKTRTLMGTLGFLSPELFSTYRASKMHAQYNPYKSDVFSLGLCILFFCTFKKMSGAERLEKVD